MSAGGRGDGGAVGDGEMQGKLREMRGEAARGGRKSLGEPFFPLDPTARATVIRQLVLDRPKFGPARRRLALATFKGFSTSRTPEAASPSGKENS